MGKMHHILEEVQVSKRCGDQSPQKTEEAVVLNRKIETLEQILKDYHAQFLHEVQHWPNRIAKAKDETGPRHLHSPAKEDYNNEESERQLNKNALVGKMCF